MKHYLVTAKITIGELEQSEQVLVHCSDVEPPDLHAYLALQRGPKLDPTDNGYFDMGGEIHLQVTGTQEVAPEHLDILKFYLLGKPLPPSSGWHVRWEIELDRWEDETPKDAAIVAAEIAIDQFMKLTGRSPSTSVTKPALTINGELIDFELEH